MVNAPETSSSKSSSSALIPQVKGDVRNRSGIAHYTQHWDKNSAKDTAENTEARKEVYTDVVNGYYDVRFAFSSLFLVPTTLRWEGGVLPLPFFPSDTFSSALD